MYLLVDESVHQQAMDALQRQRDEDAAVIQQGLGDMHTGRGMSLDESRARTLDALVRKSGGSSSVAFMGRSLSSAR